MKELITILLGSFKFAMTFPLAILEFKFTFFETLLWINIGGIFGVYFFGYLSEWVNRWIRKLLKRLKKPNQTDPDKHVIKKAFTKRNRRIVHIKQKYGLIGIAATTPLLLSIPVGVFLTVRYYPRVKSRFIYLIASNIFWSLIYTGFFSFWNGLIF